MHKREKENSGLGGGRVSKPRAYQASSFLGARGPLRVPWSSLRSLLKPSEHHEDTRLNSIRLESFSFNTGKKTEVNVGLFAPEAIAAARPIASNCGGEWTGPAGKCRARITPCGGSALISLEQSSCRKALGLAVVTWSELLAPFAWGELLRANEDGGRRFDAATFSAQISQFVTLPRMGTLVWPTIEQCVDAEALFLIEGTFWLLGLAIAQKNQRTNK